MATRDAATQAEWADIDEIKEKQWLLGLEWKLGPGRLNASAQWMEVEVGGGDVSDKDIYKMCIRDSHIDRLADKISLDFREIAQVGDDLRILARLTQ